MKDMKCVTVKPMQPSSGDSVVGVMTSILMAANIVCKNNTKEDTLVNPEKPRLILYNHIKRVFISAV